MQRSLSLIIHSIHIRTIRDQQFDNFLMTAPLTQLRCQMQRSIFILILRIHSRTSSQVLFH